jgi:Flp pilus assembly protein TadG
VVIGFGHASASINRLFDQDVTGRTERKLSYTLDIKEDQVHLEFLSLQSEPLAFREPAVSAAPQTDEPAANSASKTNNKPARVTVQSKDDILNNYPQWRSFLLFTPRGISSHGYR